MVIIIIYDPGSPGNQIGLVRLGGLRAPAVPLRVGTMRDRETIDAAPLVSTRYCLRFQQLANLLAQVGEKIGCLLWSKFNPNLLNVARRAWSAAMLF
jgi:hypothetical protein